MAACAGIRGLGDAASCARLLPRQAGVNRGHVCQDSGVRRPPGCPHSTVSGRELSGCAPAKQLWGSCGAVNVPLLVGGRAAGRARRARGSPAVPGSTGRWCAQRGDGRDPLLTGWMTSKSGHKSYIRSSPRRCLIISKKLQAGVSLNSQDLKVSHCRQRVNSPNPTQRRGRGHALPLSLYAQ